jgi:hypothetical protein
MKCGACKDDHATTFEVKVCYDKKYSEIVKLTEPIAIVVEAPIAPAKPSFVLVPGGSDKKGTKYAVEVDGVLRFYRVKSGTKNPDVRFVNRLIGHPGSWASCKVSQAEHDKVLTAILNDAYTDTDPDTQIVRELVGPEAAAVRYSRKFKRCSCCDAPLSDPVSRAMALGPVCRTRFALVSA